MTVQYALGCFQNVSRCFKGAPKRFSDASKMPSTRFQSALGKPYDTTEIHKEIHEKAVLKYFWLLAQNHCQNGSKVSRASYFLVWTEYLSGFWNLRKPVLKHFWLLAQNHCQNGSKVSRASYFSVWTEYLVFGTSRRLQDASKSCRNNERHPDAHADT